MLDVIFEDEWILAIEKPSGIPSHTLENSIEISCEAILHSQRPHENFFLLHRLDTGTSGVLLFAKSKIIFNEMRELFKFKKVQKKYLAWTESTVEKRDLLKRTRLPLKIETPLAHHPKSSKRMIALPEGKKRSFRGKPIPALSFVTAYREDRFAEIDAIQLEIEIVTGVMHQIRVHLDSLGLTLLGDAIYENKARDNFVRMALHAREVRFQLRGREYLIESSKLADRD